MQDLAWMLVVLLGIAAAWLGWRYFALRAALRRYERSLQRHAQVEDGLASEVSTVARVVRQLLAEDGQRLTQVVSERDRLAAVLDQLADGVLIADLTGEIQYSNPAAEQVLQVSDPRGKTVTEVLRDYRLVEVWRRSVESGGMHSESVEIPTRHQFLQLVVVPDTHGGGSLLLAQDLTRLRRLETVRQDFVSNVSHELRTPLASLRALAETLLDGALGDPEAAPQFLQRIITEVDSLSQLTQELLDLTAIESGKDALRFFPADPRALVYSAAERMRLQIERAGLTLQVDCVDKLPLVRADSSRLEQVFLNLIHNAVKFTPPGGCITLSAGIFSAAPVPNARQASCVLFSVRDTGQGIAADDLPRIFERFYRADRARTSGGTGMGLSIARHIVEAHGGQIWAESTEGESTTLKFTIPEWT